MTSILKPIGLCIRDIWVHDHDANESSTSIEDLDMQTRWFLTDCGGYESAGLDVVAAEGDGDFGDHVDVGEDVGHDVHLGDALFLDFAAVGAPGLEGEVAVDGAGHISCNSNRD